MVMAYVLSAHNCIGHVSVIYIAYRQTHSLCVCDLQSCGLCIVMAHVAMGYIVMAQQSCLDGDDERRDESHEGDGEPLSVEEND